MTITKRYVEVESIFLVAMIAGLSLLVVVKNNYRPQFSIASSGLSMQVPTVVIAPKITVSSQISPDGTKKVIMKVTQNFDGTSTYDFLTANENDVNETKIFTKILDASSNMTIPFNTWSPDDKYFFIQENSGVNKSFFVFQATGAQFAGGETFLNATDLFAKANTGNNFNVATGWASESLIIINTTTKDNAKGPSYWFEVPSTAIIQLSTEF
jgi:hypothetical protein